MGLTSIAGLMAMAGVLFVPLFIIAIVMLGSVGRAFVLAGTFAIGAVTAGMISLGAAMWLSLTRHSTDVNGILVMLFAAAGAVAGGVLAVLLLGKLSKYPPWRRY